MENETLIKQLNTLAQEYLFLDSKDIDIPTAGKFLNHLEIIMDEAKKLKINAIRSCAASLSQILEKTILDQIDDKAEAAAVFEQGIHLMQEIADSYQNTGKYDGGIQAFLEKTSAIAGVASAAQSQETQAEQKQESTRFLKPTLKARRPKSAKPKARKISACPSSLTTRASFNSTMRRIWFLKSKRTIRPRRLIPTAERSPAS